MSKNKTNPGKKKSNTKKKCYCFIQTFTSDPKKYLLKCYRTKPLRFYKINLKQVEKDFKLKNSYLVPLKRSKLMVSPDDLKPNETYIVDGDKIIEEDEDDGKGIKIKGYKTGIVYDEKMLLHTSPQSTNPEIPERIKSVYETLETSGLLDECKMTNSRAATNDELEICHTPKYIKKLKDCKIKPKSGDYDINPGTFEAASVSTGSILQMCDDIMSGQIHNGFCVTRPPGHHAKHNTPMGFCYFGNVAIAAKYVKQKYDNIKRVLILDWDVHHGNGTQELIESDKNILLISIQRNTYPGTGRYDNIGGKGNIVNIQFDYGYGDGEMLEAFSQIVVPITLEFRPDFIIISAGYDAVKGDRLGGCKVSPETYSHMTQIMMQFTGGKNLCVALEGGYNISQLSNCVEKTVRILRGHPISHQGEGYFGYQRDFSLKKQHWLNIREVIEIQSKHFKCMKMKKELLFEKEKNDKEKLKEEIKNLRKKKIDKNEETEGEDEKEEEEEKKETKEDEKIEKEKEKEEQEEQEEKINEEEKKIEEKKEED